MRVLSLIASSTEIVHALGLTSQLVGRSHECDFPIEVRALPQVTRPAIPIGGTSKEIDEAVKGRVKDALSIYEVDRSLLRALQPEVILTQSQCEVCAVSLKDVERALADESGVNAKVVSLTPNSLSEIFEDIRRVASALNVEPRGEKVIASLKGRMGAIERIVTRKIFDPQPRVALIEWLEPLMAAGNWMPELVRMAGGVNLFGEPGKHSPWMSWDELIAANPDKVVIAPCGFDLERTMQEIHLFTENPRSRELRAFREGQVYVADGNQYFNRPGPRVAEALEILAEIFYPEVFTFERPLEPRAYLRLPALQ